MSILERTTNNIRNKLKFRLKKEEKIEDEKMVKEKLLMREEAIMKQLERAEHQYTKDLQLAKDNQLLKSQVQRGKRALKMAKMREIEEELKQDKMARVGQMFEKMDSQTRFLKGLNVDEHAIRMRLKTYLD